MATTPDFQTFLDDITNRLGMESIIAQVGRDEGLIPAYSLLGELSEKAAEHPAILAQSEAVRTRLDKLLDAAAPYDDAALTALRDLVAWLPKALVALKAGDPLGAPGAAASGTAPKPAAPATPAAADHGEGDELMVIDLAESHELLVEFHAEATDHLQQIEAALLTLDEDPADKDALASLFRSFHTFKGVAGFLHLKPMQTLAHEVESLLDLARNGKLHLTPAIITEVLRSRDALQLLVGQVQTALESGRMPDQIVPVAHLITAVRRFAEGGGEQAPAPEAVAPAPVSAPAAVAPVKSASAPAPAAAPATAPQVVIPFPAQTAPAPAAEAPAKAVEKTAKSGAPVEGMSSTAMSTVRVNTDKLDMLMDVVGELVIAQSQLAESARALATDGSPISRDIAQLGRITKELQHTTMSLRMVPVKSLFQRIERLTRDLSQQVGKKVQFQTIGEDTEVDRSVVEEIADPLVHMVRNSLDHGVETPEQRVAAGKRDTGLVTLKAYHQGSNIVIELVDDGRGIDPVRVLAKARERGLVAETVTPSREETLGLIFLPGFSTAEKITNVSGRGVGMDVVKRNIDKLRGKVEVDSEVGKGTTIRIRLPLTTAIIDGLIVRVGADRFILPSTSVQMALRPATDTLATVQGRGEVLDHRGKILPIHRLHERFNIPGAVESASEGILVIVEANGRVNALLVDEMVSKQEVVIKSLGGWLRDLRGVSGGAILGDGNIALILDPASLFNAA